VPLVDHEQALVTRPNRDALGIARLGECGPYAGHERAHGSGLFIERQVQFDQLPVAVVDGEKAPPAEPDDARELRVSDAGNLDRAVAERGELQLVRSARSGSTEPERQHQNREPHPSHLRRSPRG
jgi:hypothetical protein